MQRFYILLIHFMKHVIYRKRISHLIWKLDTAYYPPSHVHWTPTTSIWTLTNLPSFPITIFSFSSRTCLSDPDNLNNPSSFIPLSLASISSSHWGIGLTSYQSLTNLPSFPITIFSFSSRTCLSDPDNLYNPSSFIPLASISSTHWMMSAGICGAVGGTNSSRRLGGPLLGVPATGTQGSGTLSLQSGWHTARQSDNQKQKII